MRSTKRDHFDDWAGKINDSLIKRPEVILRKFNASGKDAKESVRLKFIFHPDDLEQEWKRNDVETLVYFRFFFCLVKEKSMTSMRGKKKRDSLASSLSILIKSSIAKM